MPPYLEQRETLIQTMNIQTKDDEHCHQTKDIFRSRTNSTEVSISHSSHDVQAVQLRSSFSCDTGSQKICQTNSSVSIGSPRSVFVPVSQSPQHFSFEKKHKLLPPNTSTNQNDLRPGGVLEKWQNLEKSNQKAAEIKSKPVEYRFRPISQNEEKDHHPEIKKSVLSSRAKKRKHVPFTHIIIRDDDTTISTISCDPSEKYDVDVLYSFAEKFQNTNIEAHKELLQETNELIERISRHNLDKVVTEEDPKEVLEPEKFNAIDKEKLLEDTNQLLDQIDEQPLAPEIAGLETLVDEGSGPSSKEEGILPASILEAMDNDLSQVEQRQDLPPEIEAFGEDNDLSFDDLRDDSDPPEEGKKLLYSSLSPFISSIAHFFIKTVLCLVNNTSKLTYESPKDPSLLEKGISDNFFSDDEGLSLMSPAQNDDTPEKGIVQNAIQMLDFKRNTHSREGNQVEGVSSNFKDSHEKENVKNDSNEANDFVEKLNPRMHEKASVRTKAMLEKGAPRISYASQRNEQKAHDHKIQLDDDSERGGIATIIQKLENKEKRQPGLEDQRRRRTYSPPMKEIFIPTIHEFSTGFQTDPIWKSPKPMKQKQMSEQSKSRVRTKLDNDTRIQNIMRRGKNKFLNRWSRKKMPAVPVHVE